MTRWRWLTFWSPVYFGARAPANTMSFAHLSRLVFVAATWRAVPTSQASVLWVDTFYMWVARTAVCTERRGPRAAPRARKVVGEKQINKCRATIVT